MPTPREIALSAALEQAVSALKARHIRGVCQKKECDACDALRAYDKLLSTPPPAEIAGSAQMREPIDLSHVPQPIVKLAGDYADTFNQDEPTRAMIVCGYVNGYKVAHDAALEAACSWRPMESAPKDGTSILASGLEYGKGPARYTSVCFWHKGYWVEDSNTEGESLDYLTHWMPLPAPPKPGEGG
jgi:hypothetical protein